MPLAWSVCIVSQHDSALEHFSVRRGLCGGFGRELAKFKAVSGGSEDARLVEPDHHHQGRLSTAGYARRGYGAAAMGPLGGVKQLLRAARFGRR